MIRYLLLTVMIMLTPPKGNGGLPHAPSPAVVEARVWDKLAVQELAHDGRWTQAAEELVSSCGLTEVECRELQEESGSFNDEMLEFIDMIFGHTDMIGEGEDDTE